jgi:hypothetical protein
LISSSAAMSVVESATTAVTHISVLCRCRIASTNHGFGRPRLVTEVIAQALSIRIPAPALIGSIGTRPEAFPLRFVAETCHRNGGDLYSTYKAAKLPGNGNAVHLLARRYSRGQPAEAMRTPQCLARGPINPTKVSHNCTSVLTLEALLATEEFTRR